MPVFVEFTPSDKNPGWSTAVDDQGQEHVVLTSYAEENYQPPPPPLTPEQLAQTNPLTPEELAATGEEPLTPPEMGAAPVYATPGADVDLLANVRAASGAQPLGAGGAPGASSGLVPTAPGVAAQGRFDPMAEVVAPGTPGGVMAPATETEAVARSEQEFAVDADERLAEYEDAYSRGAEAEFETALDRHGAELTLRQSESDFAQDEVERIREETRKAELLTQEQKKIADTLEETPIDEDFFQGSAGRQIGAWFALGLSGFLQGATRGTNSALNQMMAQLNAAQDRFIRDQRADRDSKLNRRIKALGDAELAERTVRMQLPAALAKRAQADAQLAALQEMPPAFNTIQAKWETDRLEHTNAIANRVTGNVERRLAEERRATAATGPVRAGDVRLRELGVAPEAHTQAITKENLGGAVAGAERLQDLSGALEAIAAANDGSLPLQETVSWRTLGLSGLAARLGFDEAKEEITVKQLLEEAKLAFKQTINIKSVDSENEGKNFNAIMDTGEGSTTVNAVRARAEQANREAVAIASAYSRDAQGYLDFVRGTMANNQGVQKGRGFAERPVPGLKAAAPAPAEQRAVDATTGGAPATRPLVPPAAAAASIRSFATRAAEKVRP